MNTPQMGDKARDRITGFEGVVTGHCEYITGCDQLLLAPPVDKEGAFRRSEWFDADRCEVVAEQAVEPTSVSSSARPGPDREAPRR